MIITLCLYQLIHDGYDCHMYQITHVAYDCHLYQLTHDDYDYHMSVNHHDREQLTITYLECCVQLVYFFSSQWDMLRGTSA